MILVPQNLFLFFPPVLIFFIRRLSLKMEEIKDSNFATRYEILGECYYHYIVFSNLWKPSIFTFMPTD